MGIFVRTGDIYQETTRDKKEPMCKIIAQHLSVSLTIRDALTSNRGCILSYFSISGNAFVESCMLLS